MEEKKMLIAALNESMNNASRLERENAQLQEVENRLRHSVLFATRARVVRACQCVVCVPDGSSGVVWDWSRNGMDGKSTPESIIRQIELNGSSVLMYTCTRLQDKIAILGAAIATHNPNVIMTVILYLRVRPLTFIISPLPLFGAIVDSIRNFLSDAHNQDTLSQLHLFEILADPKHAVALSQYRHLLAQWYGCFPLLLLLVVVVRHHPTTTFSCVVCSPLTRSGYESELAQLYHFLEWPQKEGMFMLRQAFRIKNVHAHTLFQTNAQQRQIAHTVLWPHLIGPPADGANERAAVVHGLLRQARIAAVVRGAAAAEGQLAGLPPPAARAAVRAAMSPTRPLTPRKAWRSQRRTDTKTTVFGQKKTQEGGVRGPMPRHHDHSL
jgi:hypothetical protein